METPLLNSGSDTWAPSGIADVDACADLWGGRVVMGKEELNAKTPVAPVEMTKDLCCPLLGIFGNDDRARAPSR